jgi:hypothetical protein
MKYYTWLALLLSVSGCAFAQINAPQHTWNITLKIVDESGQPVAGVKADVGFFINSQPASLNGLTDTNGIFTASHTAASDLNELGFTAVKTDYYTTRKVHMLYPPYDPAKWNIDQTLVLKKIGKPIGMYAKKYVTGLKLPEFNKKIGFDLMVGDWVGPFGKGITGDITFEQNYTNTSSREYYSKLTVSFPKSGDGIQVYTIPDSAIESGLRSPHEAPTNNYQPELTRETSAHPGQSSKFDYDPSRIYLFRVRTVKDNEGNIVSAHYGKIYGDFMQFGYYLNPTPNDRNVEFDPKQNLLGGLKPLEQVTAP